MDQFIPVGIQSRIGFMLLYGATGLPRGSPIVEVSNQRSPDCGGKCVSLRLVRMDQFIYCTVQSGIGFMRLYGATPVPISLIVTIPVSFFTDRVVPVRYNNNFITVSIFFRFQQ